MGISRTREGQGRGAGETKGRGIEREGKRNTHTNFSYV